MYLNHYNLENNLLQHSLLLILPHKNTSLFTTGGGKKLIAMDVICIFVNWLGTIATMIVTAVKYYQ